MVATARANAPNEAFAGGFGVHCHLEPFFPSRLFAEVGPRLGTGLRTMPLPHILVAAPVIDIDATAFIQGGIYVALILILNPLLFKPWLAALARREDAIAGALVKAKTLRADADAISSEYDRKLEAARDQALELRAKARRDEEAAQAAVLAEARREASIELDRARERSAKEAEEARTSLAGSVDDLAKNITQKVLGRAV